MFSYRSYCTDSATKSILDKLNKLENKAKKRSNFVIDSNLFSLIRNVDILKLSYENLKSKPGVVPETLDGVNMELLNSISDDIKNESFKFNPSKKTTIAKKNGNPRNLLIAPLSDKLVLEAIKIILTAIYEPVFLSCSRGFRPDRSCHSALLHLHTNGLHSSS